MSDWFEYNLYVTNPKTGEDEEWVLEVDYLRHSSKKGKRESGSGIPLEPSEPAFGEILSIKDATSHLPIQEAMPHWNQSHYYEVFDALQDRVSDPFIY